MVRATILSAEGVEPTDKTLYGDRATRHAELAALDVPLRRSLCLTAAQAADIAAGKPSKAVKHFLKDLPEDATLILRGSPQDNAWGGPPSFLHLGLTPKRLAALIKRIGERNARRAETDFVRNFASFVGGMELESAWTEGEVATQETLTEISDAYAKELEAMLPTDPEAQIIAAITAMLRDWNSVTAKILRQTRGAPEDAGLPLILQEMTYPTDGFASVQFVKEATGYPALVGNFSVVGEAERQPLETLLALNSDIEPQLKAINQKLCKGLKDAFLVDVVAENGKLFVADAQLARRSSRAAVRIVVDLVKSGALSKNEALLRIEPRSLVTHLHPQLEAGAKRDIIAAGLPASPGAASGRIVFSPQEALKLAAQELDCILVRPETTPEDIRGMHSAAGVLTIHGGMTSHAAVIARGLGIPCVVGAGDLRIDAERRELVTADGRIFGEGVEITLDGTEGQVMSGTAKMIQAEVTGSLGDLLNWADEVRTIGVRANADTPTEARQARDFWADGLGLCRSEHMFFAENRINVMRKMILTDEPDVRKAALESLLPMQRNDFIELFEIMVGKSVTIRLLDQPLHEFLPSDEDGLAALAVEMGLPLAQVRARVRDLAEVNPMLGSRGVRLGIVLPEIYEMQVRAIFEAAAHVNSTGGAPVVPEIMVPLISANREVELVKASIDATAASVAEDLGGLPDYHFGIMVETPRAALRAGDLAENCAFLSFGTNDLTQMTYGLSRDDAGRFMRDYVNRGVFPEDPFLSLDLEGVGELLLIAGRRGRDKKKNLMLGLCGEHGGDPASVRFCKLAGFDYVSCSPYRVPIARLAAAQASILVEDPDTAAQ